MSRVKNSSLIDTPFILKGKPVRLVTWNWRADKEYKNESGIDEVLQVTWSDDRDPQRGWVGDVWSTKGHWYAGQDTRVSYPTARDAAFALVLRHDDWKGKLTEADLRKFEQMYIASLTPGVKKLLSNPGKSRNMGGFKPGVPTQHILDEIDNLPNTALVDVSRGANGLYYAKLSAKETYPSYPDFATSSKVEEYAVEKAAKKIRDDLRGKGKYAPHFDTYTVEHLLLPHWKSRASRKHPLAKTDSYRRLMR